MSIYALHGFLGHTQDFKPLEIPGLKACAVFHTQICPIRAWALRFNRLMPKKAIIMGYSMGGRLALNCLINNPTGFKAAIILAAHPGIAQESLRSKRYEADKVWSKRFLEEPWDLLMKNWHDQPALRTSLPVIRKEGDFDRQSLARALRYFSLGCQEYLVPQITALDMPILWLAPREEAQNVAPIQLKNPLSRLLYMPKGGHRFMMAEPKATSRLITSFLRGLE